LLNLSIPPNLRQLGNHIFETFHNSLRFGFLEVCERTSDEHHQKQHRAEVDIGPIILVDAEGDEAKNTTSNEQ